jgi:hypothetical protein
MWELGRTLCRLQGTGAVLRPRHLAAATQSNQLFLQSGCLVHRRLLTLGHATYFFLVVCVVVSLAQRVLFSQSFSGLKRRYLQSAGSALSFCQRSAAA